MKVEMEDLIVDFKGLVEVRFVTFKSSASDWLQIIISQPFLTYCAIVLD